MKDPISLQCPMPIKDYSEVLLAHGGGGRLMNELIEKVFRSSFAGKKPRARHDGAVFQIGSKRLAFTTDSYVVHPLFFPGGDIGRLAVFGTVNDLAMCGARPLYLSAGFILEEGFPIETLSRVVESMKKAAKETGVEIITGDTKVVERSKADGVFINTAGIGVVEHSQKIMPKSIKVGDQIILSGDLGRHGMAIMALREGLKFESKITSDLAPLNGPVQALLKAGIKVRCLRDLTRGGLSSALNEIADDSGCTLRIRESEIPVRSDVRGACEILGLDPLYVANEGRMVIFTAPSDAKRALNILKKHEPSRGSCLIGEVADKKESLVVLQTSVGTHRVLDMLSGEQLPRIC